MNKENKRIRALVLFSGGLDSILAVKILQNPNLTKDKQGVEVTGLTFVSYFFNDKLAQKAARGLNLNLKTCDISDEHLSMVKKPKYGYGKALNPCIDCHLMMIKKAKAIMDKENYSFVATGEVLGERPMSQNKKALTLIEKESGLKGHLLRPLSAKLLEPTILEKEKKIKRDLLLDISGRSRKVQIALAKEYGIKNYPTPAGGCLLTELHFGARLQELLDKWPKADGQDAKLIKIGRQFWFKDNLIVVGRNHQENLTMKEISKNKDVLIEPSLFPGPSILIRGQKEIHPESLSMARDLMIKYSPKLNK